MIDEKILQDLMNIKGYRAAAISTNAGELIISDTQKLKTDLSEVSATFNDIFVDSHVVSKKMGLGPAQMMEIHTEGAVALMSCSGEDSRIHLHIFAIFTLDGNITLAKMAIKKILPKAVELLA
jgi:predicted regulator of Ras-like GTPase activity (Roadblock/LC7/MglB family)